MENSKFKVLVIGARDFQIRSLNELGIFYTLFQIREELTSYQTSHANELLITEYRNIDSVLSLAKSFHDLRQYDAVIGYREFAQYPCSLIAKSLSIPSNCHEQAVIYSRDKQKMRQLLKGSMLDNVASCQVNSIEQIKHFLGFHAEAILKPADGTGSIGVIKVNKDNIEEAYDYSIEKNSANLLIEQYIGGKEYSVESISLSGQHQVLAVTEKLTTGAPYFVEIGHNQPAQIDGQTKICIEKAVGVLLDMMEHQTGPCHTEIKVEDGDVYIIETHIRNGGDNIWEMTQITSGIDIFKSTIRHLLGIENTETKAEFEAVAIRYIMPKVKIVKKISNLEKAKDTVNVMRMVLDVEVGDEVKEAISSHNRYGYVIAQGATLAEASMSAELAKDTLTFE